MPRLQLVTLHGTTLDEQVYEVLLPTPDGQIGVFEHHSPLVTMATTGVVSVRRKSGDKDDDMDHYAIGGGAIEIVDNHVKVLVDEATDSHEIVEEQEQKAIAEAKKMLSEARDKISMDKAQSMIGHHQVRLRVAGLKKRKR